MDIKIKVLILLRFSVNIFDLEFMIYSRVSVLMVQGLPTNLEFIQRFTGQDLRFIVQCFVESVNNIFLKILFATAINFIYFYFLF